MAEKDEAKEKRKIKAVAQDEGDHDGLLYRCEDRGADGEEGRLDHERRARGAPDRDGRHPRLSGEPRGDDRGEQDGGRSLRKGRGDGLFERPVLLRPRRYRLRPDQRRADRRPPPARHARLLQQHLRDGPQMVRGAGPVLQGAALHPRHPFLPHGVFRGGAGATSRARSHEYIAFLENVCEKKFDYDRIKEVGRLSVGGAAALAGGPGYGDEPARRRSPPSTPSSTWP